MSGRPRTTSFAESCKPVPQPSAFGSMKVSSKYTTVILVVTFPYMHKAQLAGVEWHAHTSTHTPLCLGVRAHRCAVMHRPGAGQPGRGVLAGRAGQCRARGR
ncbi:glycogen synthase kinase-3 beta isoform X2 [Lates japonicus]|uniref:Glycogen synthase kinase-3 beta isoform X2 n=1 Tax=Lates japonicus TaxID=270547 RepID=A0AAD3RKN8_LATJO|nr:glycogen synthase kinase-3 beta isoform X2 [Lates japonicus]